MPNIPRARQKIQDLLNMPLKQFGLSAPEIEYVSATRCHNVEMLLEGIAHCFSEQVLRMNAVLKSTPPNPYPPDLLLQMRQFCERYEPQRGKSKEQFCEFGNAIGNVFQSRELNGRQIAIGINMLQRLQKIYEGLADYYEQPQPENLHQEYGEERAIKAMQHVRKQEFHQIPDYIPSDLIARAMAVQDQFDRNGGEWAIMHSELYQSVLHAIRDLVVSHEPLPGPAHMRLSANLRDTARRDAAIAKQFGLLAEHFKDIASDLGINVSEIER